MTREVLNSEVVEWAAKHTDKELVAAVDTERDVFNYRYGKGFMGAVERFTSERLRRVREGS